MDLIKVKRDIIKAVKVTKDREKSHTYYTDMLSTVLNPDQNVVDYKKQSIDFKDNILDIR